ncbi:hypothetical protein [Burkholderia contaminans]|uniref:hypothetical protein n=1 Tax=Burkholderia contaminans TaxID=488447 RepID=UPI003D66B29A
MIRNRCKEQSACPVGASILRIGCCFIRTGENHEHGFNWTAENQDRIDERRRGDAQHTVAPTRTRHTRATSRGTRPTRKQETKRGTVIAGSGGETGQPLWEDDGGALPPEEWS